MMKKISGILLAVLLLSAWGVRFYFVNRNLDIPVVQVFPKGTEVPVGEDFFIGSDEEMDGYTVTVLGAELVSVDDFLQRYHGEKQKEDLGNFTDYIYMVRVSVGNQDNPYLDEKGIDLEEYYLKGTDYVLSLEDVCYWLANPDMPGTSFSLRQDTSMELLLPFSVMSFLTSREHILSDAPKLQISDYPHQKLLELYKE